MKQPLTKAMKKRLRNLSEIAYERDLSAALTKVETDFMRWRKGEIDAFELSDRIHAFHDGPSREVYKTYVTGQLEWSVAYAIERGILTEAEAGPDVVTSLTAELNLLRPQRGSDGEG